MSVQTIAGEELEALYTQAAEALLAALVRLGDPRIVLALPGGRSIVGLLRKMGALAKGWRDVWGRLELFLVDERLVPLDHGDSNYRLLNECFFAHAIQEGLLQSKQIHPFRFDPSLPGLGTEVYRTELERYGGRFHGVVLGVGEDGHVAALFPRHHSIDDQSEFFLTMDDSPKPPPGRMSASVKLIRASEVACVLFIGEGKRRAYEEFRDPGLTLNDCPAKIISDIPERIAVTNLSC